MTEPEAAEMTVRQSPRVDLEALRNLRRLLDATSLPPDDRSSIDRRDGDIATRAGWRRGPAVAAWRQRMGEDEVKGIDKQRAATAECANAQARIED